MIAPLALVLALAASTVVGICPPSTGEVRIEFGCSRAKNLDQLPKFRGQKFVDSLTDVLTNTCGLTSCNFNLNNIQFQAGNIVDFPVTDTTDGAAIPKIQTCIQNNFIRFTQCTMKSARALVMDATTTTTTTAAPGICDGTTNTYGYRAVASTGCFDLNTFSTANLDRFAQKFFQAVTDNCPDVTPCDFKAFSGSDITIEGTNAFSFDVESLTALSDLAACVESTRFRFNRCTVTSVEEEIASGNAPM